MGNECTKFRKIEKKPIMIRWNLINEETDILQLNAGGKNIIEQYNTMLNQLKECNQLTEDEKIKAVENITFMRDRENLVRLKEITYPCEKCGEPGYTELFCEHCVRKCLKNNFINWTSGSEIIDKAIQNAQLKLPFPRYIIEWISFDDLETIVYKTKGGFSKISTAIWKKGVIMSFDKKKQEFVRGKPITVILKNLSNGDSQAEERTLSNDSQAEERTLLNGSQTEERFLKELETHISLCSEGYTVATCYGITKDTKTGDYILVLANYEQDLGSYIKSSYDKITWKEIYKIFYNISEDLFNLHKEDLHNMHKEKLIHCDLHDGNILKSKGNLFHLSDFGLSGPVNKKRNEVYGKLPFIAPEVLTDRKYTTKTDIYSISMLMYYVVVGKPPFFERKHDPNLLLDIINGFRPTMPKGLPQNFQYVMELCWDPNPDKRPSAKDLYYYFLSEYEAELKNPSVKNVTISNNESIEIHECESTLHDIRFQKEQIVNESYSSQSEDGVTIAVEENPNLDSPKDVEPTSDYNDFFQQFRQKDKMPRLAMKANRMVEEFHGYAAFDKESELKPYSYTPKPLGDEDLEVGISHCGICGSDLHTMRSGWRPTLYPAILGHEIVGNILKKGSKVSNFNIGDRVGISCQVHSCGECVECTTGYDQLCAKRVFTYNDMWKDAEGVPTKYQSQGGYSDKIRAHSRFVFHIPEEISSAEACPLLCAGLSTFAPLKRHKVGPGNKVGISGIGGLGHMAIQWAAKMGAEVTAISHSEKRDEAIKLGATHFLNISDPIDVKKFTHTQDIILSTSCNPQADWSKYMNLIKNHGTLILIGLPEAPLQIPVFAFMRFVKVEGSLIGGSQEIKDMLAFAVKHNVRPWIQKIPMKDINEGIKIVRNGKAKYRVVLEN
ncbi:6667_t:CDS:10 [Cetraspora pellucida]|uniref:6667_t:CDS:1 n=1 Tax=Cetraspora pellucida TaxID=1433469 RepID=A0A9N8VS71_9GLOM|nr:6667_t:CDS:10 [Cetraspora pellucida]